MIFKLPKRKLDNSNSSVCLIATVKRRSMFVGSQVRNQKGLLDYFDLEKSRV